MSSSAKQNNSPKESFLDYIRQLKGLDPPSIYHGLNWSRGRYHFHVTHGCKLDFQAKGQLAKLLKMELNKLLLLEYRFYQKGESDRGRDKSKQRGV